jgi:hypothetical protein
MTNQLQKSNPEGIFKARIASYSITNPVKFPISCGRLPVRFGLPAMFLQ